MLLVRQLKFWASALSALLLSSHLSAAAELSDRTLQQLPDSGTDFDINDGALLAPVLIPRVPNTEGSRKVLQHFVDFFKTSLPEWHLELQNSTWVTPVSNGEAIPFVNLIATRDPPWSSPGEVERLALVAHYDSLSIPEGFIGAIDSAAPCAMLLHVARGIDNALSRKWAAMKSEGIDENGLDIEKGIQILLLDGEEAFRTWTDTDSIYGARALAQAWEDEWHPAMSTYPNKIESISLFVLLDLLGDKNPHIRSFFKTTHWAYQRMATLEVRLRDLGLIRSSPNHPSKRSEDPSRPRQDEPVFLYEANKPDSGFFPPGIGDDHVPFMARGVDILHLIPAPFPDIWHTAQDDGEHLDMDTVEDWAKIVMAFTADWMDLEGHFDHPVTVSSHTDDSLGLRKPEDGTLHEMDAANVEQGHKEAPPTNMVISKTEL